MEDAARKCQGPGRRKRPHWFEKSKHILDPLIQKRDDATKHWNRTGTADAHKLLQQARKRLKKAKVKAQNSWIKSKAEEIESMNASPKEAWKACYELNAGLTGHHKPAMFMRYAIQKARRIDDKNTT